MKALIIDPDEARAALVAKGLAPLPSNAWGALSDLQRFALAEVSRDNHDIVNFAPALSEVGLLDLMRT